MKLKRMMQKAYRFAGDIEYRYDKLNVNPKAATAGLLIGGSLRSIIYTAQQLIANGAVRLPADEKGLLLNAVATATAMIGGSVLAFTLEQILKRETSEMQTPKVLNHREKSWPYCTGQTNTGTDAVILVSDRDHNTARDFLEPASMRLIAYLDKNHSFLGHPVDKVHYVPSAKATDLMEAVIDKGVSSIAVFGHGSVGSWDASDDTVTNEDIHYLVQDSHHCKNGFGLKATCNVKIPGKYSVIQSPTGLLEMFRDRFQLLAPAYNHPSHAGDLLIVKSYLAGDGVRGSKVSYAPGLHPKLVRLSSTQR